MKQTALLHWIETAERDRFCQLAGERLRRPVTDPAPTGMQSLNALLASLRKQLCLGDAHPVDLTRMRATNISDHVRGRGS
jgi:hypothetical protein